MSASALSANDKESWKMIQTVSVHTWERDRNTAWITDVGMPDRPHYPSPHNFIKICSKLLEIFCSQKWSRTHTHRHTHGQQYITSRAPAGSAAYNNELEITAPKILATYFNPNILILLRRNWTTSGLCYELWQIIPLPKHCQCHQLLCTVLLFSGCAQNTSSAPSLSSSSSSASLSLY